MRRVLGYGLLIVVLVGIMGLTITYFYGKRKVANLGPMARQRIIQALQERFDADVDLGRVDISLYPRPKVTGNDLVVRHKGWPDAHPLIRIHRFTAETDYDTLIARRNHVDMVRLEGLEIHIPHRGASAVVEGKEQNHDVESEQPGQDKTQLRFLIETIDANGAFLEIEPKVQGKLPLQFHIAKLMLHSVGPGQPMTFNCELTNAKPPGLIASAGTFGPWQKDDPRATAVSGKYTFAKANLGVFKGISGTLSSSGEYHGVLQRIEVDGTTDTPNFALKRGGERVHLRTKFHSVVNGTDGDTILDPVDATFLHSEFICRGGILHQSGPEGKTVSLDAAAPHARMEDILLLVMGKGKPILTGPVDFKTKILIPPGHADVLDKLRLDGQFQLSSAEFTSPKIEERLSKLSDRALGVSKKEQQEAPETVASDFDGRFVLDKGQVSFSKLTFSVPGAAINLAGTYDLRSGEVNMNGQFRMDATLSATQSGLKHWMLKPFDRFFEKDGAGFEIPITVSGSRSHPEIGAEVFHRHFTIH